MINVHGAIHPPTRSTRNNFAYAIFNARDTRNGREKMSVCALRSTDGNLLGGGGCFDAIGRAFPWMSLGRIWLSAYAFQGLRRFDIRRGQARSKCFGPPTPGVGVHRLLEAFQGPGTPEMDRVGFAPL